MCGSSQNAQRTAGINEYLSRPENGQFGGGENDISKMLTNMAGGRDALTADNQSRYDKMPWAPKRPASASPQLGSGGGSTQAQPAAKTVSSTILGGTA